jgi:hypothetical protein
MGAISVWLGDNLFQSHHIENVNTTIKLEDALLFPSPKQTKIS